MANETFTATQTTVLTNDVDNDGQIDPGGPGVGDTVTTTVTITNNSTNTNATGVTFTETLNGMTLVNQAGNDINVSPIAFNDAYTAVGNTLLEVGNATTQTGPQSNVAGSVIANDVEFFGDTFVISAVGATNVTGNTTTITTALGGTVTMVTDNSSADRGSFTYISQAGDTGTDTFTYTVRDKGLDGIAGNADDLVSVGTVSITLTNKVWYIDNTAGPGGDGTSTNPFDSLADVSGASGPDGVGDFIYVNTGSGNYTGGITLLNNQTLHGEGAAFTVAGFNLAAAGTDPTIANAAGSGVTLASGNTLTGFTVGNTTGFDITNTAAASAGSLTISDVTLNGSGGLINIDSGGTLNVQLNSATTSAAGTDGINLNNVDNSTFTVTGVTTINDASSDGIAVTNSQNSTFTFTGKTTILNDGGANGDGVDLQNNNAVDSTFNFNGGVDITVNGTDAFGFRAQSSGTVNILNPNSDNQITSNNGTAIFINPTAFQASLTSVTAGDGGTGDGIHLEGVTGTGVTIGTVSLNGMAGDGIDITNTASAVTINGGSIGNTNDPGGIGVDINGGTGNVTISATINDATAANDVVEVTGRSTGTVDFNGNITSTGGGIDINTNTGGTVRFDGGMNLSTGATTAFNATGNTGATLVVTDTVSTSNILATTTGTALNVANTTIGAEDLTFQSISKNGAGTGIVLNNTGAVGNLNITGDAGASNNNSGGTIQNATVGISLTDTRDVVLDQININNIAQNGIDGFHVTNFTLTNSTITTTGTASLAGDFETSAIAFVDRSGANDNTIDGTVTMTGNSITDVERNAIMIETWAGTISNLNISNNTLDGDGAGTTNARIQDAVHVFAQGTTGGITTGTISNNTISDFRFFDTAPAIDIFIGGNGIRLVTDTNSVNTASTLGTGVNPFVISGNDIDNVGSNMIAVTAVGRTASANVRILDNGTLADPMTNAEGLGISVFFGGNGTFNGLVHNNVIDNIDQGANPSGSSGIGVQSDFGGNTGANTDVTNSNFTISNNTISDFAGNGIIATGINNAGTMNVRIIDNDVLTIPDLAARFGIRVQQSNVGTQPTVNLEIHGNDTAGGNPIFGPPDGIGIRQQTGFTFGIEGLTPSPATGAQAATYINSQNPGETTTIISGNNFTNVNVPDNPVPLLAGEGGVEAANSNTTANTQTATLPADDTPDTTGNSEPPAVDNDPPSATDTGSDPAPADEPAPVQADPQPAPVHPVIVDDGVLSQAELDFFVDAAIARWSEAGLTEEQLDALEAMSFGVADMSGLNLGSFSPTQIMLDADAAGRGWYLDGSPLDDSEFGTAFSATWLQTDPTGGPAGHYDLLTTVMHEMGHALGLGDSYASGDRGELMYGWLYTGERRLPGADDADGAVAGSITSEEFLGAPLDIGTLPFGKSVTIQWQATINAQSNQIIVNPSNQGTVAANNAVGFPDKPTDDPAVGGANDPNITTLDTLSLGNLVFNDVNKDGLFNAGDSGVNGVTLSLFVDANNDNVIDNEAAAPIATTTTAGGGLYSFAGLAPGNYIVRVDQGNFVGAGALNALNLQVSSTGNADPDNNVDNDDNGSRAPGAAAYSQTITLAYNTEPTAGTGNDTNDTLDFGFISNTPPTAANVGPFTGAEDATSPARIAITLSGTDADVGDAVVSFTIATLAANGQLFDAATGGTLLGAGSTVPATGSGPWTATVYFQPNADFNGATSFTYTAFDGDQNSAAATASITVNATNDPVTGAAPANASVNEDTPTAITGMSIADVDATLAPGGTYQVILSSTNGTLTLGAGTLAALSFSTGDGTADATMTFTGTLANINTALATASYTSNLDYNGSATITLQVTDDVGGIVATGTGAGTSDSDVINVTVNAANDPVTGAAPVNASVNEDTPTAITGMSIADVDATLAPGGTYQVTLSSTNGTLTLTTLAGLSFTTGDGSADTTMTFAGTLADINTALGTASYTPNADYNGSATVTLQVTDDVGGIVATGIGAGTSDSDVINVTVNATNDPVTGTAPANASVAEDGSVAITGLSIADVDATLAPGGTYQVTLSSTNGTLTLGAGTLAVLSFSTGDGTADATMTFTGTLANINTALATASYTSDPDFNGAATITLQVTDDVGGIVATGTGAGTSDSDVINVTVNAVADIVADTLTTTEDNAVTANVITGTNGASADNFEAPAVIQSVTQGTNGGVTFLANGEVTYTPNADFNGVDTFQYTVLSGGLTETATVTVNIGADADIVADTLTTTEDNAVTANVITGTNGASADNFEGAAVIQSVTQGTNGGVTFLANGEVTYTPNADFNGVDSFQYTVLAGGLTETATVTVNIGAVADIVGDGVTVGEDSATNTLDLLFNDTFENINRSITAVGVALNGTTAINDNGTPGVTSDDFVTYTPNADYSGPDTFAYAVTSGGVTETAIVNVTVSAVADTPSVTNAVTNEDNQTAAGLVISRNAADGPEVTHFKITGITNGTLFQNDGTTQINDGDFITFGEANAGLKFTPAQDFNGEGSFQAQASTSDTDAGLGGSLVTANITVNPVNDDPVVANAITDQTSPSNAEWVFQVPANVFNDVDGDVLTHTALLDNGDPLPAWLTFNGANRTFTGTPPLDFVGQLALKVSASDASSSVSDTFNLDIVQSPSPDINLSEGDDNFIGTGLGEVINGLGGNDNIQGGAGNDRINGNAGNDNIDGGSGANVLHGNDGGDRVIGIGNLNTSFGDDGADQLFFIGNQNQLYGGEGNDWHGVSGNGNALAAGAGDDFLGASGAGNTLAGQDGTDFLFAVGVGNALHGETGNDWLGVSGSFNTLFGGADNDWLGATGNGNTLDGGAGNDTLVTGPSSLNALFVFHAGYGIDEIVGFNVANGHVVNMETFGLANFSALQPFMSQVGADVVITINPATILTMHNVNLGTLGAAQFDLV